MWCRISQVASGWFLAFSQYPFQNLSFFVDGGYFTKRIVFTYCLKVWCQMFEDTSCSLSKLCVLPSCWPLPEVARGWEERRLAVTKSAWAMQTAANRSLRCLPTPGLLPNVFQAVRRCLLLQRLGLERTDSPLPVARSLAQPLETAKVRGKPGTRDREMAVGGRVIYRGERESRSQCQPGAVGPRDPRNPE